jgi:hypothetical protein
MLLACGRHSLQPDLDGEFRGMCLAQCVPLEVCARHQQTCRPSLTFRYANEQVLVFSCAQGSLRQIDTMKGLSLVVLIKSSDHH